MKTCGHPLLLSPPRATSIQYSEPARTVQSPPQAASVPSEGAIPMITHRQFVLALVTMFMASCNSNGTSSCILCGGPKAANLEGTVSGLVGYRLQLQNGSTPLNSSLNGSGANGSAILFGTAKFNTTYNITVRTQPTTPSQTCAVANGTGNTGNADVTNIAVTCATNPPRFVYVANRGAGNVSAFSLN